jgi:TRAP-type uncharacterized transport system fused permease subunit
MDPLGVGLLLKMPKDGSVWDILFIATTTAVGIFALAAAAQGWLIGKLSRIERAGLLIGGLLMVFSRLMSALYGYFTPWTLSYPDLFGMIFIAAAIAMQLARRKARAAA